MRSSFAAAYLLFPLAGLAQPQRQSPEPARAPTASVRVGRAFAPADWYRVTTLGSPALSPDGRLAAVTVTTVKGAENKRHSEVWVVPTTGCPSGRPHIGGCEPARYTAPGYESSNPRFSPDGKLLFFTSNRPGGKGSRWALRMDQPGGEAFQPESYPELGSLPRDNRFAIWTDSMETDSAAAADSTKRAGEDLFAKMGATARPPFGAITRPLDPARFDGRHVVDLNYKGNGRGFLPNPREARRWRPSQVWMQELPAATAGAGWRRRRSGG